MTRRGLAVSVALLALSCAGPTPPTSPRAFGGGVLEGRVTRVVAGTPIGGAVVRVGSRSATSDADGFFRFVDLVEAGSAPVVITEATSVTREAYLLLDSERFGLNLDLIPAGPPFSAQVYREIVHDGLETPRLVPLSRWTIAPSLFLTTVHEPSGREIPPQILDAIERMYRAAVPELTGGQFRVASVARGPAPPPPATGSGWVVVRFLQALDRPSWLGSAFVGQNVGRVSLKFDPDDPMFYSADDESGCLAQVMWVAEHELAHIMGYHHSSFPLEGPIADPGCDGRDLNPILTYHAAIAYSRLVGHLYPDKDQVGRHLQAGEAAVRQFGCDLRR